MSDVHRDPVKEYQDEEYEYRQNDPADYPTEIAGPGGRTSNIENNERGILDAVVGRAIARHRVADLATSQHDIHAQGVYKSTDPKYRD